MWRSTRASHYVHATSSIHFSTHGRTSPLSERELSRGFSHARRVPRPVQRDWYCRYKAFDPRQPFFNPNPLNMKLSSFFGLLTSAIPAIVSAVTVPGADTPLFYLVATGPDSAGVNFLVRPILLLRKSPGLLTW